MDIFHCVNLIECTTPRVNCNVNSRLWVITTCPSGFVGFNKVLLWWKMSMVGEAVCVWGQRVGGSSVLSAQCCCEPDTALKTKVLENIWVWNLRKRSFGLAFYRKTKCIKNKREREGKGKKGKDRRGKKEERRKVKKETKQGCRSVRTEWLCVLAVKLKLCIHRWLLEELMSWEA